MTYPQPHLPNPTPPQPAKNNQTLIIVLAVLGAVVLMCAICGGVTVIANLGADDDPPPAASTTPPIAAPATQAPEDTARPTLSPTPSPTPTAPAVVTMPNLVGQNAAVAADRLEKLGFTEINYGSQDPEDTVVINLANWTVTKQSTKAGQKVPTDTLIVLTCTKQ